MNMSTEAMLDVICVHLDVESPREITIEAMPITTRRPMYKARSKSTWTYVDRTIAVHLREQGASWQGDIARDPCAVA